jgi:hypothetical protein
LHARELWLPYYLPLFAKLVDSLNNGPIAL